MEIDPPGRRISIVDDDAAIREALKGLMRSARYPVDTFASAEEFLERANPDEIACLILDIRLPGMSGMELQERLNERGQDIPIIFISAHADEAARDKALENGAVELLNKPVRRERLFHAIGTALLRGRADTLKKGTDSSVHASGLQSKTTTSNSGQSSLSPFSRDKGANDKC